MSGKIPMIRMMYTDADREINTVFSPSCGRQGMVRVKTPDFGETAPDGLSLLPKDILVSDHVSPGKNRMALAHQLLLRCDKPPVVLRTSDTFPAIRKAAAGNGVSRKKPGPVGAKTRFLIRSASSSWVKHREGREGMCP